jgi:hypothetical protein
MTRICELCGSNNVWDRALSLDASGNVTTPPAEVIVVRSRVCLTCNQSQSLGPANDRALAVTQELVALYYADDPPALGPMINEKQFFAGLADGEVPDNDYDRMVFESGQLAAILIELGGQA